MEVSAEVHFAQTLASNDKKFRDRALKRLKKYISVRSSNGEGLGHDDFIKLWKGLHYCMWMQDKPLIQEELSEKMVSLLHAFPKLQDALSFVNVFFITETREWTGIDRLRLDKFMMLIRGMLHETFELLSRNGWPVTDCQRFSQCLTAVVMNEDSVKIPYGIKMHLADIYVAEIRKVSLDEMNAKKLSILMFPFIYFLLKTRRHELSRVIYDKTLRAVFQEYGVWPSRENRQQENTHDRPKKQSNNKKTEEDVNDDGDNDESDEEMDVSEDEEEEELENTDDEEEEESGEDGDDDDDDVEMDEQDGTNKKPRYDLSCLLRLMHRLAQDPKVEIRNRRYVYGIVNNYAVKDPTILTSAQKDSDEDADDGDINITSVFQLTGEEEKEDGDKKSRRRKRKKRREEEEDMEEEEEERASPFNEEVVRGPINKSEPLSNSVEPKNHGEGRNGKKNKTKKSDMKNGVVVVDNRVLNKSPKLAAVDKENNKEKKFVEPGKELKKQQHAVEEVTASSLSSSPSLSAKKNKKRKRLSNGQENDSISDAAGVKKMKIGGADVEFTTTEQSSKKSTSPGKGNVSEDKDQKNGSVKSDKKSPARETSNLKDSPKVAITTTQSGLKSPKNKKAAGKEMEENKNNNVNENFNIRSPLGDKIKNKKLIQLTSPVECVVYKQKSPTKPISIDKITTSIASPAAATTKFIVSDFSSPSMSRRLGNDQNAETYPLPADNTAFLAENNGDVTVGAPSGRSKKGEKSRSPGIVMTQKSPPKSKKSTQQAPATPEATSEGEVEESIVMGSLYNVMSTPCNMIKKAVGLVAPATDPGASREKTVALPDQLTPGAQKKVVFDLRKNKANKFQDYLKTLAKDPSPAFEPSKSPGQGILKSPSVESVLSSQDNSFSGDSTPNSNKRKKGKSMAFKRKSKTFILRGL